MNPGSKSFVKDKLQKHHRRCSAKKSVLRNFSKFTRKHLCQRLFFNKVAGLRQRVSDTGVFL